MRIELVACITRLQISGNLQVIVVLMSHLCEVFLKSSNLRLNAHHPDLERLQ